VGKRRRLVLPLACALLACALLAPAGALAQADDGPLPGGVGSGAKDQGDKGKETPWSKIVPYELKDPKGVTLLKPTSLIQAIPHVLAEIVWGLALYLLWLALLIFSWAFDVDLMNGPGGALGPVGQTVDGIYSSLGGSFLVAAVLVAGLWALFRGVAQRRYAQTVGGLGLSVLCVAGALWAITDPQATVGQLASWSQDGSAGFLSLTQEAAPEVASEGPGAPLPGSSSAGTRGAADTIFNVGVVEPTEVLNGEELVKVENGLQRLGLSALAAIGTLGIALFVGFFALAVVLLQAVALLIFAFAPAALIAAVVPGRGHDVFATWAKRLGGALLLKALLSLMFGIVLAIGAAVLVAGKAGGGGAGGMGWLTGFFLYAAFFWTVLVFYSRIFGGLPLRLAAAPVSGGWNLAKARYREHRADTRQDARDERREHRSEELYERQTRERGLEGMRRGREALERDVTPAHVRDERMLAEQDELRAEQAQLEGRASTTPAERERLEEVRAAVVSDDAYGGLEQRIAEHKASGNGGAGGYLAAGGFASAEHAAGPRHPRSYERGGVGAPKLTPTNAFSAESQEKAARALARRERARERADHARRPISVPTGTNTGERRPIVDIVEDFQAGSYRPRGDRPVPAASWHNDAKAAAATTND